MSDIKHTAEPWEISKIGTTGQYREITANFGRFSGMVATVYGPDCDADARRIVACVNACAGLSTDKLEAEASNLREWLDQLFLDRVDMAERNLELKAQRDELLAALKCHQEQTRPIQQTIDVIAKVEGKL